MFLLVNLIAIALYLTFLWLDIPLPLQITGVLLLLFFLPYNITRIAGTRLSDGFETYFSWLTVFFFITTPAYYLAHRFLGIGFDLRTILLVNIFVFLLAIAASIWRGEKLLPPPSINIRNVWNTHSLLILSIVLFIVTHVINYSFYIFIPESDGYADIRNIERYLEGDPISGGRKPGFYVAMTALSSFTHTDPYYLFSFWMIILQTTLVIVAYLYIRIFNIQNKILQFALLLGTLAVPVINLEIDIVRPQTFYMLIFPIWTYFLYQGIKQRNVAYWIYAGVISIFGMLYHEFFLFLSVIFGIAVIAQLFKDYYLHTTDKKDKTIFGLGVALLFSLVYSFAQEFRGVTFALRFIERTWNRISDVSEWRWWFLHSYTTDGAEMGWPGISGAAQYYGYYLSPALLFVVALFLFVLYRYKKTRNIRILLRITIPLLIAFFFFAEIMPRMNHPYLPERFWVLITPILTLIAIPTWRLIEQNVRKTMFGVLLGVYICLIGVGIFGSFYVAHSKGSETSLAEYRASQWMREHTPEDAVFITQGKNGQMVRYFGQRSMINPPPDFFLSDELIPFYVEDEEELLQKELQAEKDKLVQDTESFVDNNFDNFDTFISTVEQRRVIIEEIQERLHELQEKEDPILYVLYSEDKFNTIYAQREWWRKANFYGANLEKFNDTYTIIYSKNGVHIWKIIDIK